MHANLSPPHNYEHANSSSFPCMHPQIHTGCFPPRSTTPCKWSKPLSPFIKANIDPNLSNPGLWGLRAIIRNEEGLVMASSTWKRQGFTDVDMAEAYGILMTMKLA